MAKRLFLLMLVAAIARTESAVVCAQDTEQVKLPATTLEFFQSHCLQCHKGERAQGKLDLTKLQTAGSMAAEPKRWGRIIARVEAGEMPPLGSEPLKPDERDQFLTQAKQRLYAVLCEAGPKP